MKRTPHPKPERSLATGVLLLLLTAFAPLSDGSNLNVATVNAFQGGTFYVPVSLSGAPAGVATQFDLLYNSASLTAGVVQAGDAAGDHFVLSSQVTNGVIRVLIYSPNNSPLTNGIVAYVPFSVVAGTLNALLPITLTNTLVAAADASPVTNLNGSGGLLIGQTRVANFGVPVLARPSGLIQFQLSGIEGQKYVIQASVDLQVWINLQTNIATQATISFTDLNTTNFPQRFYRAMISP